MKSLFVALGLIASLRAFSQSINSPDVQSDGRITFRLKAPNAKDVRVDFESLKGTNFMQRGENGIWSFTTPPLEPDFYGYSFVVDGVHVFDLNNPEMKYNLLGSQSEIHVPGPKSLPWEVNDVPHGVLHRHFYKSAAAGDERAYFVYTPPGYKPTAWRHYPVLYLLHGYSDDATAWWSVGRANIILDNLIARGECKPMIVVMPLGYGTMEIVRHGWSREREEKLWRKNVDQFRAALVNEVLPEVETDYRVYKGAKNRAIAGLSMGGAESLLVGLNDLNRFGWIGAFSSGVDTNIATMFPNLNASANKQIKLLWMSCGKSDQLMVKNRVLVDWLKTKNIQYTWTEVPGEHSWRVWRRNLAEFLPLLFR